MQAPLPLSELSAEDVRDVIGVFCDIDDTLTWEGRLVPEAFAALHDLHSAGLRVVPVTGRPAGWVDQIARMWPVHACVGENGGLWFWHDGARLQRHFLQGEAERANNRERLEALGAHILAGIPGTALASDQPYRELDLAVDFCEDVEPLDDDAIDSIVDEFHKVGASAKISSIHVNGWFGTFDKREGCRRLVQERWGEDLDEDPGRWIYVGDSANDEPMFAAFPLSFGVANVERFLPRMKAWPTYISSEPGGHGFAKIAARLLALR